MTPLRVLKPTLTEVELFASLDRDSLDQVEAVCKSRVYKSGEQIFVRKERSTEVFFVIEGLVRVLAFSLEGNEVSYRDLGPGRHFGELSALDNRPRSADVIALKDSLIASISAETFHNVLRKHPSVSLILLNELSDLIRKLSARVFEFSVLGVRSRIHAELLRLAHQFSHNGRIVTISPAPTHTEIAFRVSTHREAVTRELSALHRIGIIQRRKGALIIPDLSRLASLVEESDEVIT